MHLTPAGFPSGMPVTAMKLIGQYSRHRNPVRHSIGYIKGDVFAAKIIKR